MLSFDHPLSLTGIAQAQRLGEKWKASVTAGPTCEDDRSEDDDGVSDETSKAQEYTSDFLQVERVFTSPLTRTIQTALLGLEGHPTVKSSGLTLLRNLREIKKLGGLDTKGVVSGDGIAERVKEELIKGLGAEGAEKVLADINPHDAQSQW